MPTAGRPSTGLGKGEVSPSAPPRRRGSAYPLCGDTPQRPARSVVPAYLPDRWFPLSSVNPPLWKRVQSTARSVDSGRKSRGDRLYTSTVRGLYCRVSSLAANSASTSAQSPARTGSGARRLTSHNRTAWYACRHCHSGTPLASSQLEKTCAASERGEGSNLAPIHFRTQLW